MDDLDIGQTIIYLQHILSVYLRCEMWRFDNTCLTPSLILTKGFTNTSCQVQQVNINDIPSFYNVNKNMLQYILAQRVFLAVNVLAA